MRYINAQSLLTFVSLQIGPFSDTCQLWVGANNWNPPNGALDQLASAPTVNAPFLTTDENDYRTENCVTVNGAQQWDDYNCQCSKFRFLCEYEETSDKGEDLPPDEVNPADWCKAEYEPPECPEECIYGNCQCLEPRKDFIVATYNGTTPKNVIFVSECMNWIEAQKYCCDVHDGILWEPTETQEVMYVYQQIHNQMVRNYTYYS